MAFRLTRPAARDLATDVAAANADNVDGVLNGSFFCLITACDGYDPDMTAANIDLANFDGYVGKAVTWTPSYIGTDGNGSVVSQLASWQPTGNNVDNSVIGVALMTGNNTGDLVGLDLFQTPVAMNDDSARLNYALEFGADPSQNWGTGTVIA